ncbi:hypothetical protein [Sinosporangium siamense]|uniref:hypothetical protein n=1 Tax=Sinosporangium siamense TaxID=1367973 RepID=UPI0019512634|nr:hypothetical protein [Sinosporangium siamense]
MLDEREHRLMINSDIEKYGSRRDADHVRLQEMLMRALDMAALTAGLTTLEWKRQPQGDGEFTVLPPNTSATAVLGDFLTALTRGIDVFNQGPLRMRLRLAVNCGPIHVVGAAGSPGRHATASGRLLDSDALRTAMRACPRANLGVIVSDRIYDDFIGQGYGGPSPEDFRHVHVRNKTFEGQAYVLLPGHNVHRLPELDEYSVKSTAPDGDTEGFNDTRGGGITVHGDYYKGNTNKVSGNGVVQTVGGDAYFGTPPWNGGHPR